MSIDLSSVCVCVGLLCCVVRCVLSRLSVSVILVWLDMCVRLTWVWTVRVLLRWPRCLR